MEQNCHRKSFCASDRPHRPESTIYLNTVRPAADASQQHAGLYSFTGSTSRNASDHRSCVPFRRGRPAKCILCEPIIALYILTHLVKKSNHKIEQFFRIYLIFLCRFVYKQYICPSLGTSFPCLPAAVVRYSNI